MYYIYTTNSKGFQERLEAFADKDEALRRAEEIEDTIRIEEWSNKKEEVTFTCVVQNSNGIPISKNNSN